MITARAAATHRVAETDRSMPRPAHIASSAVIGSEAAPVVVVLDTPAGSDNGWDMGGSADFFGVLVVRGDTTLKGTCSTHGAVFSEGTLLNKGNGSIPELCYNCTVIKNLNRGTCSA